MSVDAYNCRVQLQSCRQSRMGDIHIVCHNECHRGRRTYLVLFNISLGYIGDLNIFACISVCVKAAAKQYCARQIRDKLNAMNESCPGSQNWGRDISALSRRQVELLIANAVLVRLSAKTSCRKIYCIARRPGVSLQ